jgi:hypothetical protein
MPGNYCKELRFACNLILLLMLRKIITLLFITDAS